MKQGKNIWNIFGKEISMQGNKKSKYKLIGLASMGLILFFLSNHTSVSEKYTSFLRSNVSFYNLDLPLQQDIVSLLPDMQILTFFQEQSEELDALGASRAHFATIESDLMGYTGETIKKKEIQEESLKKLRSLQGSIKNSQDTTKREIEKLKNTIDNSEKEVRVLERKKQETQALLKKFYQKKYIYDTYQDENVNFMTLLIRKSFGTSIQDSEVMKTMQLFSYNLLILQKDTQEEINKTLKVIESQKETRIRMFINLEKYGAELTATENLESELLGKTVSKQGAIENTLESSQKHSTTLTQKFEQKFAQYETGIKKYSEQYSCGVKKSDICAWIQGYLQAEKALRLQDSRITPSIFPLSIQDGFGFHFRDQKYHTIHKEHHTGLDVLASENTPVTALNDGYILGQRAQNGTIPGVLIIKHRDGYISLYRNIRPKKDIQLFSMVKKGDILGTVGAFVEHSEKNNLHIEMYLRGVLVDPMEQMSLEKADINTIPGRYGWKYIDDLKKVEKNIDILALQKTIGFFYIPGENEIERQKNMLDKYAGSAFRNQTMWIEESISESVDPSFVLCVGFAESTLGQNLTTAGNIGNVGNTDSGDRRDYDGPRAGVRAIAAVVNNRWLGHYNTIDQLSGWGNPRGPIYASSPTNWHENIIKCMSALKGKYIGNYSSFRIVKEK